MPVLHEISYLSSNSLHSKNYFKLLGCGPVMFGIWHIWFSRWHSWVKVVSLIVCKHIFVLHYHDYKVSGVSLSVNMNDIKVTCVVVTHGHCLHSLKILRQVNYCKKIWGKTWLTNLYVELDIPFVWSIMSSIFVLLKKRVQNL